MFYAILRSLVAGFQTQHALVLENLALRHHVQVLKRGRRRPRLTLEERELIRLMARDNPLWDAPRIHGEPLKLGLEVNRPPYRTT